MVRLMDRETREQAPPLISREVAKSQGKTRFFPGMRCYKGHLAERYVSNGMCVQCQLEYAQARRAAAAPPPQPQEPNQGTEMPPSSAWQYIDAGRYALEYQGHVLQAIRNPDREDQRKYLAVVDQKPLSQPSWSLNEAKTKAIRFVLNQQGKAKAERLFQPAGGQAGQPVPEPAADPAPDPVQAGPQPEVQPDELWAELPEPVQAFEQPQPEPEPEPAPRAVTLTQPAVSLPAVPDPAPDAVTALFTVHVQGHDVVSALTALQAAVEMLRELGHVDCEITLPRTIRL